VAQFVLSKGELGSAHSIHWSWGVGVMMGIYASGGVSGRSTHVVDFAFLYTCICFAKRLVDCAFSVIHKFSCSLKIYKVFIIYRE
jgi:hypothetical protein